MALVGSTVIRGKKTFHISVSPTALLRVGQQGLTHSPSLPSSEPQLFVYVPRSSIVPPSGTVSHRFNVRCSLTALNKSFFSVPEGEKAHVAPFNHIHQPLHKATCTHKPNMCSLCVTDSSSECKRWKYKRYSGVGCWLLLGHITPSLPRHTAFMTPTHICEDRDRSGNPQYMDTF